MATIRLLSESRIQLGVVIGHMTILDDTKRFQFYQPSYHSCTDREHRPYFFKIIFASIIITIECNYFDDIIIFCIPVKTTVSLFVYAPPIIAARRAHETYLPTRICNTVLDTVRTSTGRDLSISLFTATLSPSTARKAVIFDR